MSSSESASNVEKTAFHTHESFNHIVTHVFFPVELPKESNCTIENDLSLASVVCAAAHAYTPHVRGTLEEDRWHHITKMLDNLRVSFHLGHLGKDYIVSQLRSMETGDIITFFARPQNAAIIITKQEDSALFELFEVSPSKDAVAKTPGSLICSYPWSVVETPNSVFDDEDFQYELAHFLSLPYVNSDLPPLPHTQPEYITALLTGILRGVGRTVNANGFTKRIRDNVGQWPRDPNPNIYQGNWRRCTLWLLIRVAVQMSTGRSSTSRAFYKRFILYFICTIARDGNNANLSNDLLHLMSSKIFRRIGKLGPSTPDWLSEMALGSCTHLRNILDARWNGLSIRRSPFCNPSQEELVRDTKLSLLNSGEYIRSVISSPAAVHPRTPFDPNDHRRGTLEDFLSLVGSFFDEAYRADPGVTIFDVEQSIEQEIDDWVAHVTDVNDACARLEVLMDQYWGKSKERKNPEHDSVKILTMLELFVAIDKLGVREVPMLADYSPGIPIKLLEQLCLHHTTGLHRLSCAYQYLVARESRSRSGWSDVTQDSFPARYYDQSQHLRQLKERIEEESGDTGAADVHDDHQRQLGGQAIRQQIFRPPLFASPLHAKIVVFELQCPPCFRVWRAAIARIYRYIDDRIFISEWQYRPLVDLPKLQPYLVERQGPPLSVQVCFVYSFPNGPQFQNIPTFRYFVHHSYVDEGERKNRLEPWVRPHHLYITYDFSESLKGYVDPTSHTSNSALAAQANCPADFSLDEFIAFAHLRSGPSLQWLSILRGLRSRTLNFRRKQVHYLLAQAAFQAGPLDLNTTTWIWHQELQDMNFCSCLIDELDNLFMDGVGLIDAVFMSTISLLVTRILQAVSNLSVHASEQAIGLLRRVRRRTFNWVQELAYDLRMLPMSKERKTSLLCVAATCLSTFDIDRIALFKLIHSAEDVDALLSCSFFIHALHPSWIRDEYLGLLLDRNSRLAPTLGIIGRDVVLADPSDRGVDLAIARIFAGYHPGAQRLKLLDYPSARWLVCNTNAIQGQPSKMMYINMLNGQLRVDGQPFGRLPQEVVHHRNYMQIFYDNECFVTPSDLLGMDFMTLAVTSNYKVYFSLRGEDLVVRAQCNQTNQVLQFIPSWILCEDLPPALVDNHVHWLNLSSGVMEIRRHQQCWESSVENWKVDCASESYNAHNGCKSLVDNRSPTWVMLSKCFECLAVEERTWRSSEHRDLASNILITTCSVDSDSVQFMSRRQLTITLPRHALSFSVNNRGELESRDFKYMVYDEDQCIRTLFGLKELVVLRPTTHIAEFSIPESLISRIALVPDGFPQEGRIVFNHSSHYHTFKVDPELGCLVDNGDLKSRRLLAYLHATTSLHRPDPLVDKMGTQAACDLLQSAGCRSIMEVKSLNGSRDSWDTASSWGSTKYPQLNAAHDEIQNRYYWDHCPYDDVAWAGAKVAWDLHVKRAARRAVHLSPSSTDRPTSAGDNSDFHYTVPKSNQELEDIAFVASSAVRCWSTSTPTSTINTIPDWTKIWDTAMLVVVSQPDYGLQISRDPVTAQMLVKRAHDILEKREKTRQRFPLLFLLPTLAYCSPSYQSTFLSMLVAFTPQVSDRLLTHADCKLSDGYCPTEQVIWDHIRASHVKGRLELEELVAADVAVKQLLNDWPSNSPPTISLDPRVWNTRQLTASLRQLFLSCHRNRNLKERLVRTIVAELGLPHLPCHASPMIYEPSQHASLQITLRQLLSSRPPPELPQRSALPPNGLQAISKTPEARDEIPALDRLFSSLQINSKFQEEYLALLGTSARASKESLQTHSGRLATKNNVDILQKHHVKCRVNYMDAIERLKKTLGPITDCELVLEKFSHWPPITADVLLRCLSPTSPVHLSEEWRKCLVWFAQLLLEFQRSRRLLRLALDNMEEEFMLELDNEQCDGWSPGEYPDWLLIQVQGDFLIRRAQAEIAMQLICPRSRENTVMQVNMGEGKSSVIIPIVAAALAADEKQLVRVIVPKALITQMFDILVARLGGLANRPIYHLPFSRTAYNDRSNKLQVETLQKLMSQCMAERGILLIQPEHVVSLKLMCVEKQIHGRNALAGQFSNLSKSIYKPIMTASSLIRLSSEDSLLSSILRWLGQSPNSSATRGTGDPASTDATKWLNLRNWVHSHVRDILDESDEVFHPRFQMIYTIGFEQHMDGYPDRWTMTGQILRLVKENLHTLSLNYPNSVEYEHGPPGSFPRVRIVRASDVGERLKSMVVEDVMAGRLPNFDFQQISSAALFGAIRSFISDKDVLQVSNTAKMVEEYAKCSLLSYLWNGLLLLRGLLSSNILLFALSERRWRVDYGHQHSASTRLAIPYRAKDVPAPNTQFGHPDLAIILTHLSYYYAGLTEDELRISFETLLDIDNPAAEYEFWIQDCESLLPDSLRKLSDINPRSSEEWNTVTLPIFARNQTVIDFYLSRVVFPKEAKEFPWKLCGSSWDLGEKREKLVTGFSGTSDGRWLLPMSVIQHDLDHQRGTSASVLTLLLRQEQGKDTENYIVTQEIGDRQTTREFLKLVATKRPKVRVLLDVGAQILDLSNDQVAAAWLDIVHDAEAAVYFDGNDELMVLPRNSGAQSLSTSPFSQQLGKCIVYLDHPHTRGTDLKFPGGSRAAVTLGPKVTKDALVQGCMRMRKLGRGHTVIFFAPPGVDQSIRAVTGKQDRGVLVTVSDVLSWTIGETWADIQHRAPYWAQQGINHQLRYDALSRFCSDELSSKQLSDAWLKPNYQSLGDLYAPREMGDTQKDLSMVPGIQQQCKVLGVLSLPNGLLEEEQEQEVHREQEREREVELPLEAKPAEHHIHPDVRSFIKTGVIPPLHSDSAFLPVFAALEQSTAASRNADAWSPFILATADFSRTIKPESTKGTMDQYLRPVQWILSGKTDRGPVLVLLSSFEADLLMPDIRASKHVHLHLYAPRTAERTKPSDDLRLYAIPPLPSDWAPPWELIDQLNVFAGQLYLRDYESYLHLCRFLDVPTNELPSGIRKVRQNLLHMPGSFEETETTSSDSPLPSVMALLAIRNRGRPFDHTHMGKILQGQILMKKHFERQRSITADCGPPPLLSDIGGDVQPKVEPSALPRPPKRGLEMDRGSLTEGPSLKRTALAEVTMSLSPTSDTPYLRPSPRVTKRALATADADQVRQAKRRRAD